VSERTLAGEGAIAEPREILAFWRGAGSDKWFTKDDAFDSEVRARFLSTYEAAVRGDLDAWERTADGALALVIVLDQFPRNMFRGEARTFAADARALAVADRAIARGFDHQVASELRAFLYMPFMHSERLADQERCIALFRAADDEFSLGYALQHADVIRRFGRFPHRNAVLGRTSTPEERAFLESGGFAG
jgi:uncharacterized protein (DUF924 family)